MIDERKYNQYGFERSSEDIKGITIHNTNNYQWNAREIFEWLNEGKTSQGCHYLIDKDELIEVMPHDWGVYHTGKGMDYGTRYTIAIEICSNLNNEDYLVGEDRAIELIHTLMERYQLTKNDIFFHLDFNPQTYCPAQILDIYGNKTTFLERI